MIVFYVSVYNGLTLLLSFSTNPIVYFWRCKLYRVEMRRVLGFTNSVLVMTTKQNVAQHNRQATTQL